jgi:hypothetical protein
MANWQSLGGGFGNQPGQPTVFGGGVQALTFRDALDARRAMQGGRIPSAEYPDGYLGTIQSRREDRLLNSLKNRLNQRSYQRGVHKGERADPADYMWPPEMDPYMAGIARQAKTGARAAPLMTVQEQLEVDGRRIPRGAWGFLDTRPNAMNPADLRRLAPGWK